MLFLDLDPNVVKPGWIPLIITILLALALVLLYLSMRRQFRKITIDREETDVEPSDDSEPSASDSPSANS
jgi:protein-S-isoprenylcysteine O-methyltransferase Ste14